MCVVLYIPLKAAECFINSSSSRCHPLLSLLLEFSALTAVFLRKILQLQGIKNTYIYTHKRHGTRYAHSFKVDRFEIFLLEFFFIDGISNCIAPEYLVPEGRQQSAPQGERLWVRAEVQPCD